MPRFEQLQHRKSRSRGESVPSTFPESYERAHGDPGKNTDELLGEIAIVLAEHDHHHDNETTRRHLGQTGLETKRPK